MLSIAAALLALASPAVGSSGPAQQSPLVVQVNYDAARQPSDPDYDETLLNLVYPAGSGPLSMGFEARPLPLQVMLRGGNSNKFGPGELDYDTQTFVASSAGMVAAQPNLPVVGPGEQFRDSARSGALCIQFLRANAAEYNLDPERVLLVGRSFGGIAAYSIALEYDLAQPTSSDPVLQQSSYPQWLSIRITTSSLNCFSENVDNWATTLGVFFFPGQAFAESTESQRLLDSPIWWMLNPRQYGRTSTPPIGIVGSESHADVCDTNTDVHSGLFMDLMWDAMEENARATGDRDAFERSRRIDKDVYEEPSGQIVLWAAEQMSDTWGGLYLTPAVGQAGGDVTYSAYGALPGAPVTFFSGTQAGNFPIGGCPELLGEIVDFATLGTATANAAGIAVLVAPAAAGLVGQRRLLHAVDLTNCEASNVWSQLYQ